jgi:hypothetical protein
VAEWHRVKWSRAEQAVDRSFLAKTASVGTADPKAAPPVFFGQLRDGGRSDLAVEFLAQAMPRLEAVVWAADVVQDMSAALPSEEADTLRTVFDWVAAPTETSRRAAMDAAQRCEISAPAWLAAMAAFYSGGSVAPPDCDPLHPPPDATGRFAAGAILMVCADLEDMEGAIDLCLMRGEGLATQGLSVRGGR